MENTDKNKDLINEEKIVATQILLGYIVLLIISTAIIKLLPFSIIRIYSWYFMVLGVSLASDQVVSLRVRKSRKKLLGFLTFMTILVTIAVTTHVLIMDLFLLGENFSTGYSIISITVAYFMQKILQDLLLYRRK